MIALRWQDALMTADVSLGAQGIETDDTLKTATIISLFTDRRARADDKLTANDNDRRGWVGDALSPDEGDLWGSRLWLLRREKETEETRRRAEEYAREALAWMVTSGLVTRTTVSAVWVQRGVLALSIAHYLPQNKVEKYAFNAAAGLGEVNNVV